MSFHSDCGFMSRIGQLELTLGGRPSKLLHFQEMAIFHSLQVDFSPAKNEKRNCILQADLGGGKNSTAVQKRFSRASAGILHTRGAVPLKVQTFNKLRIFHSLQIYFTPSIRKENLSTDHPAYHCTIAPTQGGVA